MKIEDYLKNKKVVFYGDSITHNWEKYDHFLKLTHEEDKNYVYGLGYGHVKMLNDVCHFKSVDNFAVSGGCYANRHQFSEDRPVWRHFPYQIMHSLGVLKDAEVIFIMFGTNDYSEQTHFGMYDEMPKNEDEDMSFYGGMNFGFEKIKEVAPQAQVFVVNCLPRTYPIDAKTFSYSIHEYNLAIAHNVKRYGFHLIDVSRLFKIPENFDGSDIKMSDDGVHPNQNGFKEITKTILNYTFKESK